MTMNRPMTMTMPYALYNEVYKALLRSWSYRANFFINMILFAALFVGISLWVGDGESARIETRASFFVAYIIWLFVVAALSTMTWDIREETVTGTMEQMAMGAYPLEILVLGYSLGSAILMAIQTGIVGALLVVAFKIDLTLRWAALPPFVLTLIGVYGFAYMLGGATLVFKRTESLTNLLQNLIMFANGMFVAVDKFPPALEFASRLIPSTQGIAVLRMVLFQGYSLADTWRDGSLIYLIVHSVAFFFVGMLIFRWGERIARQRGTLGQY